MKLLLILIAGTAWAQTPRASVSGEVGPVGVDSRVRISVRLQGTGPLRNVMAGRDVEDGQFTFDDLAPGDYTLSAERPGYVRAFYNASPSHSFGGFTLRAGQELSGIKIQMVPEGVLAGKVLDPNDESIGPAPISVWKKVWVGEAWRLQMVRNATAGKDGAFRIAGLSQGKYYLSAAAPAQRVELLGTYFPNAVEPVGAAAITVNPGSEIGGINLHLRRAPSFTLRGRVVDSSGAVVKNVALGLVNASGSSSVAIARDGKFSFARLLPGTYVLATQTVRLNGQTIRPDVPLVGRKAITISDTDPDEVVFELHAPARIAGSIRAEKQQPKIRLAAEELPPHSTAAAESAADGSFSIEEVAPDRYRVEVTGLAAGNYVKSVRFANQNAPAGVLDLREGNGGNLEIVTEDGGVEIAGVVRDEKGAVCPDVVVSLWGAVVRTATAGADGGFHFGNLAPGDYRVAAWEGVDQDLAALPEFLNLFASRASVVNGQAGTAQLTPIPRAVSDMEAEKFR